MPALDFLYLTVLTQEQVAFIKVLDDFNLFDRLIILCGGAECHLGPI